MPSGGRQSQRTKTSHSPDGPAEDGAPESAMSDVLGSSPLQDGLGEATAQRKMDALFRDGVIDCRSFASSTFDVGSMLTGPDIKVNLSDGMQDITSVVAQDFNEDGLYLGDDLSMDTMGQLGWYF